MNALHSTFARAVAVAFALACGAAGAEPAAGVSFTHKDWSLDCDNTGTCRASGYQSDADDQAPVSVLITRTAGPGAKVDAKVQFGSYGEDSKVPEGPVALTIGGHSAGTVVDSGSLGDAQLASLLKALAGTGNVVFAKGKARWTLSGEGAAAVLVKMDDVQGRIGTPAALVKKGGRPEAAVPGPVKKPVIQAVRVPASLKADVSLALKVLATIKSDDDCQLSKMLDVKDPEASEVELWRLGGGRVLVTASCWRAAYNEGSGYWLAKDKPPYDAEIVTASGSGFAPEVGELSSAQKGRGLGDCWASESWVWNGRDFVHASESSTGQCKLVAPGGAWDLPTLVSEVRKPR